MRSSRRRLFTLPLLALFAGSFGLASCTNRPVVRVDAVPHGITAQKLRITRADQVDLLFVVDNSSSMADKQAELGKRIPELIQALTQQSSTTHKNSVVDVHVGVVTSSLGSYGTWACNGGGAKNDRGRLLPRDAAALGEGWNLASVGAEPTKATCPKVAAASALAWTQGASSNVTVLSGDTGAQTLQTAASCVIESAKDEGCGFEATLESMYHFLIDPAPYGDARADCAISSSSDDCHGKTIVMNGVDGALLAQRAQFLRPESILAVVILSDENDASLSPIGDNWKPFSSSYAMPHGSTGCASVPDDFEPTGTTELDSLVHHYGCRPCEGSAAGDPSCATAKFLPTTDAVNHDVDALNMRAFNQVQRFGKDYLWPVQRYIDGLTSPKVPGPNGTIVANPIFAGGRTKEHVIVAGIVGVPKVLVADASGAPKKLDEAAWAKIISPDLAIRDPHMIESIAPRAKIPHFAGDITIDPINGGDRDVVKGEDLQYACIAPRVTAGAIGGECEDADAQLHDPICAAKNSAARFRAYPGLRHLRLLHGLGDSGFAASICDSSYKGAIDGVIAKVQGALTEQCLKTNLETDETTGKVTCLVLEAFATDVVDGKTTCADIGKGYCTPGEAPCRVEGSDYPPVSLEVAASMLYLPITAVGTDGLVSEHKELAFAENGNVYVKEGPAKDAKRHLICEMRQLTGDSEVPKAVQDGCRNDPNYSLDPATGGGFCYSKNDDVVGDTCRKNGAPGKMRFLGGVDPKSGSDVFTICVH